MIGLSPVFLATSFLPEKPERRVWMILFRLEGGRRVGKGAILNRKRSNKKHLVGGTMRQTGGTTGGTIRTRGTTMTTIEPTGPTRKIIGPP